jgi:ferredoxin
MAHYITDECTACGACEPECEQGAIKEADPIYIIDAEKCDDCETCIDVCPVECILKKEG